MNLNQYTKEQLDTLLKMIQVAKLDMEGCKLETKTQQIATFWKGEVLQALNDVIFEDERLNF